MLPKQPVSLFFGATNQDTGRKGVKLGDLITAKNVQQLKGGEFTKRDVFHQLAQSYAGGASTPESIISPDGIQVVTRDKADNIFARSTAANQNQNQGHADRFVPTVNTCIPALGSGQQSAPQAKQAGNYFIFFLVDYFIGSILNIFIFRFF